MPIVICHFCCLLENKGNFRTELKVALDERNHHTLLQCSKSHVCESEKASFVHRDVNGSLNILKVAKAFPNRPDFLAAKKAR